MGLLVLALVADGSCRVDSGEGSRHGFDSDGHGHGGTCGQVGRRGGSTPVSWEDGRARRLVAVRLAGAERQLRGLLVEPARDLALTRRSDDAGDLAAALAPALAAVDEAARRIGAVPASYSMRRAAESLLSILWSDLVDIEPERLRRAWGLDDLPDEWTELHTRLLAGIQEARARLAGAGVIVPSPQDGGGEVR